MLLTEKDRIVNFEDLKRNPHTVEFNGISIVSDNSADLLIIQSTAFYHEQVCQVFCFVFLMV